MAGLFLLPHCMVPRLRSQSRGQALLPISHPGAGEGLAQGQKLAQRPESLQRHAPALSLTLNTLHAGEGDSGKRKIAKCTCWLGSRQACFAHVPVPQSLTSWRAAPHLTFTCYSYNPPGMQFLSCDYGCCLSRDRPHLRLPKSYHQAGPEGSCKADSGRNQTPPPEANEAKNA